jgi:hypothetical protein
MRKNGNEMKRIEDGMMIQKVFVLLALLLPAFPLSAAPGGRSPTITLVYATAETAADRGSPWSRSNFIQRA